MERRAPRFIETLSKFMVFIAAAGAFWVLTDPKVTLPFITLGGDGFSADLKGAVISAILIGGWTAVKEYWLGQSAGGAETGKSMSRIAEASTPASAAAVVAARTLPTAQTTAETVDIKAESVNVTANGEKT